MESKKINQLATEMSPATSDLTIIGDPITGVSKKITLLQIADLFSTTGTVTSVAVTETGDALTISGSPITTAGTINIGFAGDATQYVRGDGALADFPTSTGGGSSVSYYLNSSVSQGTIGGVAYREFSKDPISGAGTDITASTNGYIASYITDANDPALLEVPAGNFNCEFYFSVNSNAHNPYVYAEVYKYDGTTFTLIGSSQSVPEYLTNGTTLSPYYFAIPVTQTTLSITDRIAIRIYVNVDTRVVTLHTENNHLCQVVTTFSKGLTSLNNLTRQVQFLATGTSGTDFNISSSTATHTFNLPVASATNTGKLSSTDWSTFNNKVPYTGATQSVNLGIWDLDAANLFSNGLGVYIKKNASGLANAVGYVALSSTTYKLGIAEASSGLTGKSFNFDFAGLTDNATRNYTLPDLSGTLALLEGTQTFTGVKTFTSDITVNGVKVGKGGGGISTNTVLGTTALNFNTTGDANTALGWNSLQNNTIGASNTGIGAGSLYQNTTGSSNTALGFATLTANTTGTQNVAIGVGSLQNNTTASYNVAIGTGALSANTTGEYNTAIGFYTSNIQTTANNNTSIGFYALKDNTTGSQNTAIGASALSKNTTGFGNTGVGQGALNDNTTGTVNSGFGQGALGNQTTGSGNTGLGYNAGAAITTGSFNIEIGYLNNGSGVVTGSYNTIIGSNITGLSASLANNIVLADGAGNIRYQWNGTNNVFGNPLSGTSATFSGNVNIGGSTTDRFGVTGTGGTTGFVRFTDGVTAALFFGVNSGTPYLHSNNNTLSFGATGANTFSPTMTLSSGNVGIGTSTPTNLAASYRSVCVNGSSAGFFETRVNDVSSGRFISDANATGFGDIRTGIPIYFYTQDTERMRITSGGFTKISNTGTYANVNSSYHEIRTNAATNALIISNTNASPYIANFSMSGTPNNNVIHFLYCEDSTEGKFVVWSNGDVDSRTNSYGGWSDIKLKENITDATPKLQDLLKVKIKNYNFIGDDKKQLGVVAQELEEIFPALVSESPDFETDKETGEKIDLGTTTKSVKYSVFVPMLIKAIQEQQAQIEELKALIAAK
jgi:hypothetical protein